MASSTDSNAQLNLTLEGYEFEAIENELVCKDSNTQMVQFRSKFAHPVFDALSNLRINKLCIAPDSKGVIVLFAPAPQGYRTVGNLARVDLKGTIIWWAELPSDGTDNYTDAHVTDNLKLYAYSWNGFSCWINEHSGKIIEKKFVK